MAYTISFHEIDKNHISLAGGKGANLGELTKAGFPVPPGFVLTTEAYDRFIEENALQEKIVELTSTVSLDDPPVKKHQSKSNSFF